MKASFRAERPLKLTVVAGERNISIRFAAFVITMPENDAVQFAERLIEAIAELRRRKGSR